ncbi:MFS transporter [Halosimplex salinum]|uniref:MFS transporter n=1 Tax=Halosimplex salinum TaxID=1710538 RepID=UPI000F48C61B|nr:MFS transporter [Halosimplex salinum]
MAATLREALRERLTVRGALQWAGLLALLWHVLDPTTPQFVTTVVSMALFGLTELVTDVYDVRQSVRNAGIGLYALVGGAAMLLFDDGTTWLPVAFLIVGVWFVADAVQTIRYEGATEDEPTGREVYHDYVARRVVEALDAGPRTRRELSETLEADDDAVDATIEKLESRGVVVREGSSLRVDDSDDEDGAVGRVTGALAGFARRIARPLTLELDSEEAGGGRAPADSNGERGRRTDSERDGAESDREHERERERARQRETAG